MAPPYALTQTHCFTLISPPP